MNDPTLLTIIGVALTALVFFLYVRWRRSSRGKTRSTTDIESATAAKKAPMNSGSISKNQDPLPEPFTPSQPPDLERKNMIGILMLLGIALSTMSLFLRADIPFDKPQWVPFPFLIIGLLMVGIGAALTSRLDQPSLLERAAGRLAIPLGVSLAQVICLFSSVMFAILATLAAGITEKMISPKVAVISWGMGILLAVIGGWRRGSQGAQIRHSAIFWALLLGVAAFLLRFLANGQIPVTLTGDEGSTGLDALGFINGRVDNLFGIFGWHPFPSLYFFIESISIEFFGRTIEALRLPSAFAGAVTVSGLYLAARSMFGHRVALVSAAFLAAMHYSIHFSRLGVMNIWDGLWYLITLGALWHGWKTGRRASWMLAGLALGLGQYFYATGRTLFVAVLLWLFLATLFDRQGWKRNASNLLPAFLTLLASLLPLARYVATEFDRYIGDVRINSVLGPWLEQKMKDTGSPAWQILLNQIRQGFGAYVDTNLIFWYQPGVPINRPFPAALFLVGLLLILNHFREMRTWTILLWLAAFGMTAALSESTPAAQRIVGCTPAVALLVGFGLVELGRLLSTAFSNRKWLIGLAVAVTALFLVADDLRFYFYEYTPESVYMGKRDFVGRGAEIADRLIHQLQNQPGKWKMAFFTDGSLGYFSIPSIQFLLPRVTGVDIPDPWGSENNPAVQGDRIFFVFLGDREADLPKVMEQFPGGESGRILGPDGSTLYTYYQYQAY